MLYFCQVVNGCSHSVTITPVVTVEVRVRTDVVPRNEKLQLSNLFDWRL